MESLNIREKHYKKILKGKVDVDELSNKNGEQLMVNIYIEGEKICKATVNDNGNQILLDKLNILTEEALEKEYYEAVYNNKPKKQ